MHSIPGAPGSPGVRAVLFSEFTRMHAPMAMATPPALRLEPVILPSWEHSSMHSPDPEDFSSPSVHTTSPKTPCSLASPATSTQSKNSGLPSSSLHPRPLFARLMDSVPGKRRRLKSSSYECTSDKSDTSATADEHEADQVREVSTREAHPSSAQASKTDTSSNRPRSASLSESSLLWARLVFNHT